jgi:hypothetical protein
MDDIIMNQERRGGGDDDVVGAFVGMGYHPLFPPRQGDRESERGRGGSFASQVEVKIPMTY